MELIFFILVTVAISIGGGILYIIYLPVKLWLIRSGKLLKRQSNLINKFYIGLLTAAVIVITYQGLFPDESFYADEFKNVTLRKLPASAEFVSKSASYPTFHGEYYSNSEIKLSKKDYSKLLWQLHNDSRMTKNGERINFENSNAETFTYQFTRSASDKPGKYLYIGFENDSRNIYVEVCRL